MPLAFTTWLMLATATAAEVHPAVAKNAEALARFQSYYLKITHDTALSLEGTGPLVRANELQIWHSGLRHRQLQRNFYFADSSGFSRFDEPDGQVMDSSSDDKEARSMTGWDPRKPFQLPLEFGRSAKEFSTVKCGIGLRDPAQPVDMSESWTLLWHVAPQWPLSRVAEVAQLVEVPLADKTITRLRIESSSEPALTGYVGALIDLDHEHDWLIRRVETLTPPRVAEVLAFGQSSSGAWLPVEVRSTLNGKVIGASHVTDFAINEPISDELLQTQFPEGARVNDSSGQIHLWGRGKPAESFSTFDAFMHRVHARAREYQGKGRTVGPPAPAQGRLFLILLNAGLLGLLALLIVLRRRLKSASSDQVT